VRQTLAANHGTLRKRVLEAKHRFPEGQTLLISRP
jgi:hypothetical protein